MRYRKRLTSGIEHKVKRIWNGLEKFKQRHRNEYGHRGSLKNGIKWTRKWCCVAQTCKDITGRHTRSLLTRASPLISVQQSSYPHTHPHPCLAMRTHSIILMLFWIYNLSGNHHLLAMGTQSLYLKMDPAYVSSPCLLITNSELILVILRMKRSELSSTLLFINGKPLPCLEQVYGNKTG